MRDSSLSRKEKFFQIPAVETPQDNKKGGKLLPKSFNHQFEKLIEKSNIEQAVETPAKQKLSKKARRTARQILQNKEEVQKQFREKLINGEPLARRKHRATLIQDGSSKKVRLILKPDLMFEQMLHHAVVQIMQPIFMRGMYEFSCGSIPGRGPHYGKKYIEKFIRKRKADIKYVLKFDIKKFYPSIDTEILKQKLRRIIHDEKMMFVLEQIIDSNIAVFPDGHEESLGVPIGYYTSQWFANFYLQDLDHYIKQDLKAAGLFHYVDDYVIFGRNKKELHKMLEAIRIKLAEIGLTIKENHQVFRFDYIDKKDGKRKGRPIDFMGFKFYRDKTTLRRSIMLKATRKARKMSKKKKLTWFDSCQLLSYMGYFLHTDTYGVFQKYIKPYVNIKNCKQRIRTRQLKINQKEKIKCLHSEKQKALKNQSDSTKQAPQMEFTSESTVQLKLFQITTETNK